MGKVTIEQWICDRCGDLLGEKEPSQPEKVTVKASVEYCQDNAGGTILSWSCLCDECNNFVLGALRDMKEGARQ